MNSLTIFRSTFSLSAAVALLAACGGSQPPIGAPGPVAQTSELAGQGFTQPLATWLPAAPTRSHLAGWLSPSPRHRGAGQPLMYVSEEDDNEVAVYPEPAPSPGPLVGTITVGVNDPWGLCIDKNKNLYSANQSGTVTEYPYDSTYPSATYSQDLGRPLYCIVDKHGDLFVGNANGRANGGTIVEYQAGSTHAYQVLQTPGTEVDGVGFDAQGNLYAAYRGGRGSLGTSIEKFTPGSGSGSILGMKLNQPQGLIVDENGSIVVVNEKSPGDNYLDVFPPGAKRPSLRVGQPEGSYPIEIAITKDERTLFVTTFNTGGIYEIRYPLRKGSTWILEQQDPYGLQQGIALSNRQVF